MRSGPRGTFCFSEEHSLATNAVTRLYLWEKLLSNAFRLPTTFCMKWCNSQSERRKKHSRRIAKRKKKFCPFNPHWIGGKLANEKEWRKMKSRCVKFDCAIFQWKILRHENVCSLAALVLGFSPNYSTIFVPTHVKIWHCTLYSFEFLPRKWISTNNILR